jgi:hypothetical protein
VSRLVALALTLAALTAAGCSSDDDSPSSSDVPSGAVAKVGDREISEDDLERQVKALARAQRTGGGDSSATGDDNSATGGGTSSDAAARKVRRDQALATLLMREALEQEAEERGVEVSDREVSDRWKAASAGQFKTKKALRRFLGGQTERDVLDQLRLQLLSERISEQVAEQAGGGKKGERAVREFQKEFQERWQNRTACAEGYDSPSCASDKSDSE